VPCSNAAKTRNSLKFAGVLQTTRSISPYVIGPLSLVCLSCLSVTLVHCGQTVRWIKMKLGTEVGLGPGHIVLDGDPATSTETGTAAPPPLFGRCLLWSNGRSSQLLSSCKVRKGSENCCSHFTSTTVCCSAAHRRRCKNNCSS